MHSDTLLEHRQVLIVHWLIILYRMPASSGSVVGFMVLVACIECIISLYSAF